MTKQLLTLATTLFLASYSFAAHHDGLGHALTSAWKQGQSMHASLDKNDMAMVYGGKDLRPSFVQGTTVV